MQTKKAKSIFARLAAVLAVAAVVLLAVFLMGRYGWKLGGFNACQSAGIESIEVTESSVRIVGYDSGIFPDGFCGYYAQEQDETLYVGFRFSGVFGFFETGDFDITIPVKGDIRQVILKTKSSEYPIWSAEDGLADSSTAGDEGGAASSPSQTPTVLQAYAVVIGEYYTALHEGWDGAQIMEAGMNYMVADSFFAVPLDDIGYAVTDLDGDGVQELCIGSRKEDEFFGKMIFCLYTLDQDGAPQLVFDSTERNRYYYAGGRNFANLGSSDWNSSFVTTLKLQDKEMIDMTYTTAPEDYVQMDLTPFSQWVG